jgi:Domain of unknown function (DUF4440)
VSKAVLLCAVTLVMSAPPVVGQNPTTSQYVPLESITLPPDLDRVLRDYERAWQRGDAHALAALFTSDGFVPSGEGWVRGTNQIIARYANAGGDLHLRALAYAAADTVAYIVGAYGYGDEPAVPDRGKFVLTLRRTSGNRWFIAADLDNTNRPQ